MLHHLMATCSVSSLWQSDTVNVHFVITAVPKLHVALPVPGSCGGPWSSTAYAWLSPSGTFCAGMVG
jgi:hypothetical protein